MSLFDCCHSGTITRDARVPAPSRTISWVTVERAFILSHKA